MGFLAVFAISGGQISGRWLTKLMNILQIAINCLHLRIIALVFVVRARHWKDKCIQSLKNTAVNSRNFSIFEVLEYLGGIELLSKFVSCLNASQTASERSYCAILRSFDSGRTVIFWFLERDAFAWNAEKSSSNLEKNTKKREG